MTACSTIPTVTERATLAEKIARAGNLQRQDKQTPEYTIAAWQRLSAKGKTIHVYIEGDGFAWRTRHSPSPNPTPTNPVALRLAAVDAAPNVIYLARPCQYILSPDCTEADWTSQRFSSKIIAAYNAVLNQISASEHPAGFALIGFSGGANIAGLLAERRQDIASLRTVSGDIDNHAFVQIHHLSPMPLSLDMADNAQKLFALPQQHFIGADDDIITPEISAAFQKKMGRSACFAVKKIKNATHETGWAKKWPVLLAAPLPCASKPKGS